MENVLEFVGQLVAVAFVVFILAMFVDALWQDATTVMQIKAEQEKAIRNSLIVVATLAIVFLINYL